MRGGGGGGVGGRCTKVAKSYGNYYQNYSLCWKQKEKDNFFLPKLMKTAKISFLAAIFNFSSSSYLLECEKIASHGKRHVCSDITTWWLIFLLWKYLGPDNGQNGGCSIVKHDHSFWRCSSILWQKISVSLPLFVKNSLISLFWIVKIWFLAFCSPPGRSLPKL